MNLGLSDVHNVYLGGRLVRRIYNQDVIVYEGFPIDGLLAFYKFNGNILDSVGTITPLVTGDFSSINYTTGLNGSSAIRFNTYGSCGSSAGLYCQQNVWNLYSGNTRASFSFWFKYSQSIPRLNPRSSGCGMNFFGSFFGSFGFFVTPSNSVDNRILCGIANTTQIYTESTDIVVNAWNHIAGTYDNTTRNFRVYRNGNLVHNVTFPGAISPPSQNFLGFGINASGGYETSSKGEYGIPIIMESVGLWNRILSEREVSVLYNSGNGKTI